MKIEIIIVSDNHGATGALAQMLAFHQEADYFLHCGDSNLNPDHPLMTNVICVKGNTDFHYDYPLYQHVQLPTGGNIWVTHGHKQYVRHGATELMNDAKLQNPVPNIVLYGHSHRVNVEMTADILFINPGSIAEPRDGNPPSYAKLTVTDAEYKIEIYRAADNTVFKEWQFPK